MINAVVVGGGLDLVLFQAVEWADSNCTLETETNALKVQLQQQTARAEHAEVRRRVRRTIMLLLF